MIRPRLSILLLACAAALPLAAESAGSGAAPRKARVAGGNVVELVPSARPAEQWAADRPRYRDLRPRVRGNFD